MFRGLTSGWGARLKSLAIILVILGAIVGFGTLGHDLGHMWTNITSFFQSFKSSAGH